ncbi:MAG: substrate-binding domain-containing protein [bacterium]|nr:substrate-binding domain-containing protein [bacterium]
MKHTQVTIGFLIPDLTDFRFCRAWQGVADVARQNNVHLRCFCAGSLQRAESLQANTHKILCDFITPGSLDGLLIFQWWYSQAWFEEFCKRFQPLPISNIMRCYEGHAGVRVDNALGGYEQIKHLVEEHGYRKIAYLLGPNSSSAQERYQAYQDALMSYDIPFNPQLVIPHLSDFGTEATRVLLDERRLQAKHDFEAIVTFNDNMALGAIEELQRRGIQVPYDVAVLGFDNSKEADFRTIPLTTVAIPWYEQGKQAAEILLEQLIGQKPVEHRPIPPQLIVRRSCGCHDPEIRQVIPEQAIRLDGPSEFSLSSCRQALLSAIEHSAVERGVNAGKWTEEIVDAFVGEVQRDTASGIFLRVLGEGLRQFENSGGNSDFGQTLLSLFYRHLQPCLSRNTELWQRADTLWQQGRVLVHTLVRRSFLRKQAEAERQAMIVREIGQRLLTTFDVAGLMDVLAQELPRLGILSCYLSLYENPTKPAEGLRLLLAYNEYGRLETKAEERSFPSSQLVPPSLLTAKSLQNFVIEALFLGEQQIGTILFGNGPQDGKIYGILRGEVSSALQGALLVQEVQERDAALVREKYVIDSFMANVPDRIYFKDRDGRLIRANKAYAERIGFSDPRAVIGKTDREFFPEEEARKIAEHERRIVQSGQAIVNREIQIPQRDGSPGWALATKMPLRDERGEVIGIFGISRDISALKEAEQELHQYRDHLEELVDRRSEQMRQINERLHHSINERSQAEQALRSSEQQYRLLAENVKDGILIIQEGRSVFSNTVLAVMLGMSKTSILSTEPETLFPKPDDIALGSRQPSQRSAGMTGIVWQAQVARIDGHVLWTEIEQTSIVWDSRSASLLTIRDITAQKLKEHQLEEERARLHQENITLRSTIKERFRFGSLIGKSPAMQQVYELIVSAAASDVNVMLVGESGTGKELIAQTIHRVSGRQKQTLVPVNCASIPETLFEREFFGHRRGAFTGADRDKPGFFDRAHQGVLFLDEVTELTPGTQAKLLRVLQDGEYIPLGSNVPKQADVLIVAATNKDPHEEIRQGRLRHDFFYRICVIEIKIPTLRERKDDLPLLIEHILERCREKHSSRQDSAAPELSSDPGTLPGELVQAMYAYDWPGNIRELQNIVQRYLATRNLAAVLNMISAPRDVSKSASSTTLAQQQSLTEVVQTFEKQVIADALEQNRYNIARAAEQLSVNLRTLYRKINAYGLKDSMP